MPSQLNSAGSNPFASNEGLEISNADPLEELLDEEELLDDELLLDELLELDELDELLELDEELLEEEVLEEEVLEELDEDELLEELLLVELDDEVSPSVLPPQAPKKLKQSITAVAESLFIRTPKSAVTKRKY